MEDLDNTVAIGLLAEQDISELFSVMLTNEATDFMRKAFSEDDRENIKFEGKDYFVTANMGIGKYMHFKYFHSRTTFILS